MHASASWRSAGVAALFALGVAAACGPARDAAPAGDTTTMNSNGTAMADSAAPRTMASPDAQMAAVLDTLGSLGGKPIETLTPAEAR